MKRLIQILFVFIFFTTCKKADNSNPNPTPTPTPRISNYYSIDSSANKATGFIEATAKEIDSIPSIESIDTSKLPTFGRINTPPSYTLDVAYPGYQGAYNSCTAWAVAYGMLGYQYKLIEGSTNYNGLDKQFSPSYVWNQLNGHVNSGISIASALSLVKQQGCCKHPFMPYEIVTPSDQPSIDARNNAANYKMTEFFIFPILDLNKIKYYVSIKCPVVFGCDVDNGFKTTLKSSFVQMQDGRLIWKFKSGGSVEGHTMLICGYDDNINAFKVLNSWGTSWGNDGFIWIDYDFFKQVVHKSIGALYPEIYVGFTLKPNTVWFPVLITTNISTITSTSANSGGSVTSDGGAKVLFHGVVWSKSENPTIFDNKSSDGAGNGNFISTLSGLSPGTSYYVRAYATNSVGTGYGNQVIFTTPQAVVTLPTVITTAISGITQTSAQSGGNITSNGRATVTARGICWSTIPNPSTANSKTADGTGTGTFTSSLTGLTTSTTYYVRAYATNSAGTAYGNEISFITQSTPVITLPTVTTTAISAITQTTAQSGGSVTSDGNATVTARGICWSTSSNPTIANNKTTDGIGTGSFTSSLTGLTANTTYNVRAYATNSTGTAYGSNISFTTSQTGGGTVTDIDGNIYHTVTIGTQVWLVENLKTIHYRNGDLIPNTTDGTQWTNLITGAWCNYNNDGNNGNTYGHLYNWYAVNDSRNIAPTGYHIPTDAEWSTLITFLGGESVAGDKMKSMTLWNSTVGITNESGFTALPGGNRYYDGLFYGINNAGYWLSVPQSSTDNAWDRALGSGYPTVVRDQVKKVNGMSLRCVKD